MAESTEISWTDSTFNPWWGCTKVSPGCDHCYAEALDRRTGGAHWDGDAVPRTMSANNWDNPQRWQRQALKKGTRRKVFCGSMCDVFDKNAPAGQRERLWSEIRSTSMLDWQLLTKRAPNITKYLPADWGDGYPNVWLGVTVENKQHGLPRIDHLREIPAVVRFISVEPLLEDLGELNLTGISWAIIGGESGFGFRKLDRSWVDGVIDQCRSQGVNVFFKQWGGRTNKAGGCLIDGQEIKEWPTVP